MNVEVISEVSEEQISFRKKHKKGEDKDRIFVKPGYVHRDSIIKEEGSKENSITISNDNKNMINKRNSINLINNFIVKETKKENIKNDNENESDSCSSLDIQKVGINSKNTRIIGGNKHSIIDLKIVQNIQKIKKQIIQKAKVV